MVRRLRALVRLDRSARALCNVERIVKETVALCQPALDQHHIDIRASVDPRLPPVSADALQIGQTLLNLMRNAIDAVAETRRVGGMITIEATVNSGGDVEVRVADNGPGFPPDFADNPFLPLTSRKAEGLGIGLPLSRSIIEAHGGRLWLDRHAEAATSTSPCPPQRNRTMADAIRLALIDDDAAVCNSLQLYFTRNNVSVTCFHAADEYLKAVSGELFDCVVTDVRMPGVSGLDLVRRSPPAARRCRSS